MSNKLTIKEVQKVADLIKIKLDENDAEEYASQLGTALNPMGVLQELNTENTKPTSQTINTSNIFRKDEVEEGLSQSSALQNAHKTKSGYIVVQKVLDR